MKNAKILSKFIIYFILISSSFFCLLPFAWLLRSSVMDVSQIFIMPPEWIPNPLKLSNYIEALTLVSFKTYFINSLTIEFFVLPGVIFTSALCAYSFARLKWPGRDKVFVMILSSMMLPGAVTMIPVFLGWRYTTGINNFIPLILPAWFGGGAFNIFLIRQFMMSIPKELDEAAFVDGAGFFRIFIQIIVPLIRPAMIVVGLFTFINTWNDFMGPLIYLNEENKFTLALGLQQFIGQYSAQWHLLMAASTVVIAPPVIAFLVGQKYLIEGITLTGLKG